MANHTQESASRGGARGGHAHNDAPRYIASFAALFVFTVLTYGLHHVDLGQLALPIAMLIAVAKALVVILFFMHLYDHPGVNRLVLGVTFVFLFFAIPWSSPTSSLATRWPSHISSPLPLSRARRCRRCRRSLHAGLARQRGLHPLLVRAFGRTRASRCTCRAIRRSSSSRSIRRRLTCPLEVEETPRGPMPHIHGGLARQPSSRRSRGRASRRRFPTDSSRAPTGDREGG